MEPIASELHPLIEENVGLAWSVALRWRRSGLDVEDLAQVGMLGLMKAARAFDPERGQFSTFATWWIRSAIGRAAEKALRPGGLARLDALDREAVDDADGPADDMIAVETAAAVWGAVDALPEKDREVIRARFEEGVSQSRIGERLGVTRTRAYQREKRAVERLREMLAVG